MTPYWETQSGKWGHWRVGTHIDRGLATTPMVAVRGPLAVGILTASLNIKPLLMFPTDTDFLRISPREVTANCKMPGPSEFIALSTLMVAAYLSHHHTNNPVFFRSNYKRKTTSTYQPIKISVPPASFTIRQAAARGLDLRQQSTDSSRAYV